MLGVVKEQPHSTVAVREKDSLQVDHVDVFQFTEELFCLFEDKKEHLNLGNQDHEVFYVRQFLDTPTWRCRCLQSASVRTLGRPF